MEKSQEQRKDVYVIDEEEKVVPEFVGKHRKLIILKKALENPPQGYTQIVIRYKDQPHVLLLPERTKKHLGSMDGSDAKGFDALDDLAQFYDECKAYEGQIYFEEIFSPQQTEISTLGRSYYENHVLNRLVKGNDGHGGHHGNPEFNGEELERLCLNDEYVSNRVKAMAAIQTGKKPKELRESNLSDIIQEVEENVEHETVKSRQVASSIGCCMFKYRTEYFTEKTTAKESFEVNPQISALETEIEEYRARKGVEISPHDAALIREYANLSYISKENPKKSFDITPPEVKK